MATLDPSLRSTRIKSSNSKKNGNPSPSDHPTSSSSSSSSTPQITHTLVIPRSESSPTSLSLYPWVSSSIPDVDVAQVVLQGKPPESEKVPDNSTPVASVVDYTQQHRRVMQQIKTLRDTQQQQQQHSASTSTSTSSSSTPLPVVRTRKELVDIIDVQFEQQVAHGMHKQDLDVAIAEVEKAARDSTTTSRSQSNKENDSPATDFQQSREMTTEQLQQEKQEEEETKVKAVVEFNAKGEPQLIHYIRQGDTLVGLVFLYGVPKRTLLNVNGLYNTENINERDKLIIPLSLEEIDTEKFQVTMVDGRKVVVKQNSNEAVRAYNTEKLVNRFILKAKGISKPEAKIYIEEADLDIQLALKRYKDDLVWEQMHTMPVIQPANPRMMGNAEIYEQACRQLKVGDYSEHKPTLEQRIMRRERDEERRRNREIREYEKKFGKKHPSSSSSSSSSGGIGKWFKRTFSRNRSYESIPDESSSSTTQSIILINDDLSQSDENEWGSDNVSRVQTWKRKVRKAFGRSTDYETINSEEIEMSKM